MQVKVVNCSKKYFMIKINPDFLDAEKLAGINNAIVRYSKKYSLQYGEGWETGNVFAEGSKYTEEFCTEFPEFKPIIDQGTIGCNIYYLKFHYFTGGSTSSVIPHRDAHLADYVNVLNLDRTKISEPPQKISIYYLVDRLKGGVLEIENNGKIQYITPTDNMLVQLSGDAVHGVTPTISCNYRIALIIEASVCEDEYLHSIIDVIDSHKTRVWNVPKNNRGVVDVHTFTMDRIGSIEKAGKPYLDGSINECWKSSVSFKTSPLNIYTKFKNK